MQGRPKFPNVIVDVKPGASEYNIIAECKRAASAAGLSMETWDEFFMDVTSSRPGQLSGAVAEWFTLRFSADQNSMERE